MFIGHGRRNHLTERIRRFFGGEPCRVQVAALPWRRNRDGELEVLLITSRGTGRWVLPKGWPEESEAPHQAAAREAAEEAGICGAISPQEIGRFYYGKVLSSGAEKRCVVHVFPMEVDDVADRWPERKQRTRRWFSPQEAASLVDEADLGELIAGFGIDPLKVPA